MNDMLTIGGQYHDRYKVLGKIGEGGTSLVYKLWDPRLRRHVCLKKAKRACSFSQDQLQDRLSCEARILGILAGKYAPRLYEYRNNELEIYMDLLDGRSLDDFYEEWIAENKFPGDLILSERLFVPLLDALDCLHGSEVVLGDLKPKNIFLTPGVKDGEFGIYFIDFGSSRIAGTGAEGIDYTPGFGALEILRGGSPSKASDLYSMGAVFFSLLARRLPEHAELLRRFGSRAIDVFPPIQQLVFEMTHDSPEARPSCSEALDRLRQCIRDLKALDDFSVTRCPHCRHGGVRRAEKFCPVCGEEVSREQTRVIELPSGFGNPVETMYACDDKGDIIAAAAWAKRAYDAGLLADKDKIRAIEISLKAPFAESLLLDLCRSTECRVLSPADQRRYLLNLGRCLGRCRQDFVPYIALFEYGVERWPEEEMLWVWLAKASEQSRVGTVLSRGLEACPMGAKLRVYLGEILLQAGKESQAMALWMEAADLGEAEHRFLRQAYELAKKLRHPSSVRRLKRFILHAEPKTAEESLSMAEFARSEGEREKAVALISRGLEMDPHHLGLRKAKARVLLDNGKFELLFKEIENMAADDEILLLRGVALFMMDRFDEASRDLATIPDERQRPQSWEFLVISYAKLKRLDLAEQALTAALQYFPDSVPLNKLKTLLGQARG
jgi:tetratricopeptide (TPR) repeat protein